MLVILNAWVFSGEVVMGMVVGEQRSLYVGLLGYAKVRISTHVHVSVCKGRIDCGPMEGFVKIWAQY